MQAFRFRSTRLILTGVAIFLFSSSVVRADGPVSASPVSASAVDACVEKAIAYLYSQEKDGTWDPPAPQPDPSGNKYDWTEQWTNWGGPTALTTYALLAAGESPNDPRLVSAIKFLKTAQFKGTYSIAMRSEVWSHLPYTPEIRTLMQKDAEQLHAGMITKGVFKGLWNYSPHGADSNLFDNSNSQYGVLGLWSAADIGLEIPSNVWQMMDKAWRESQHTTGAWSYRRPNDPQKEFTDPRFTMTAAGIATLYLTDDYLAPGAGINCGDNLQDKDIERGIDWLGEHFDNLMHADDIIVGGFNYGLYGLERVGVASGRKYIGKVDWYQFGVEQLLKLQHPEGGWRQENGAYTAETTTALGLLFLAYGRSPVAINKLAWELPASDSKKTANWNERPRDAANLLHWMGRQTESSMKWQVVRLHDPVNELHDAPVLYLSGNQTLNFAPEDLAKLKDYVEQGGLILGNANCANHDFADSFRKIGKKMFADYEFKELPAEHIIYSGEQYLRTKWRNKPSVLSLGNGVREFMILVPTIDLGRLWQLQDFRSKPEGFELMDDILLYASDQQVLKPSRDPYYVFADPAIKTDRTLKAARLQYAGNWDPEPGGWRRLADQLHNTDKIDLRINPIKLGDGQLDATAEPLASLTGTASLNLSVLQIAELKKYIDAGGTLLIDAAGGSTPFAASAEKLITQLTPPGTAIPQLDASSPAMAGVKTTALRRFEVARIGKSKNMLPKAASINGRPAIIYSPLDLSAGLVGQPIDGIAGYEPEAATQITTAIVKYANHK